MTKKILVVDDDAIFGALMCRHFIKRNYSACWAESVADARQLCEQQLHEQLLFELAVLDLKLEQETSLALIPYLLHCFPQIKILMLTGYASIATTVEAIKLGATNYLPLDSTLKCITQPR